MTITYQIDGIVICELFSLLPTIVTIKVLSISAPVSVNLVPRGHWHADFVSLVLPDVSGNMAPRLAASCCHVSGHLR